MRIEFGPRWFTYEVGSNGLPAITGYGDISDPKQDPDDPQAYFQEQQAPYWRIEWPVQDDAPSVHIDQGPIEP